MTLSPQQWERTVPVELGTRSYNILIGEHRLAQTATVLAECLNCADASGLRFLIVADTTVAETYGRTVSSSLASAGAEIRTVLIPSGEQSKSVEQLQRLYDALVDMAADRRTIVIALGGGVTGDLAGFAAATYARGLRFVQIPTTLLAMVDSSVGGKTGINHPKGKNLIGAFHQPIAVLIDLATLGTLPDREYRAGLAEVVKYGVILDQSFFEYLEQHIDGLNARDPEALRQIVARSCELKADVVRNDEFETSGLRAVLNYGHTFGHAFEALAGYGTLLHGEAVAIGMVCASRLAEQLGRISAIDTERQVRLLQAIQLPVTVPPELCRRTGDLLQCMLLDKKTEGRTLRFVLPTRLGHVEVVQGVSPEQAMRAISG
jgi:3-dehydroquinate synthase